ncbi:MAG: hypothetical protein AB1502_07575, partial [Thermodesulfobacteriota bacterium]
APAIEWWNRESLIEWPVIIELFRHTKNILDSIRNLTQLSRVKFSDKEFGEFFCRSVTKDTGKVNLLLEGFLQYLLVNTSVKKKDTIHRLIEEVLKKYQVQLEEKGIKLSKKFEKDLPEAVVPDELMRYILNSLLQYGVNSVTPSGEMGLVTKSFIPEEKGDLDQALLGKDKRYIEIELFFAGYKKLSEPFEKSPGFHKEEPLNLILRLVKEVVQRNRGIMKIETDEKKEKTLIFISFPSERREVFYYQSIEG